MVGKPHRHVVFASGLTDGMCQTGRCREGQEGQGEETKDIPTQMNQNHEEQVLQRLIGGSYWITYMDKRQVL